MDIGLSCRAAEGVHICIHHSDFNSGGFTSDRPQYHYVFSWHTHKLESLEGVCLVDIYKHNIREYSLCRDDPGKNGGRSAIN